MAWAFATMGCLDMTMVTAISEEVFEWLRQQQVVHQVGMASSCDFAVNVISLVWAFNFAGVLKPEFAEPVREALSVVGRNMDCARLGSHKLPRFRDGSHSGP